MNGNDRNITGTAMAVLLGFGAIVSSIFWPGVDLGPRVVIFAIGLIFAVAGLYMSKG